MSHIQLKKVKLPNGEEIAYQERDGGDDKLVLIHGNMTSSVHWDLVIDGLSLKYKVYAIDLRGFGRSSYHRRISSIKDFSDDVRLWVDAIGIKDFFLAGWSLGGAVAQQFCIDNPDYCKKLFLLASVSSRGYPYYSSRVNDMPNNKNRMINFNDMFKDFSLMQTQIAYNTFNYIFLKGIWDKNIYTNKKPDPVRYQKYLKDMTTQRNLGECYHALNNFNISDKNNGLTQGNNTIKSINIPVMIAWGENDQVIRKHMTDELIEDYGSKAVNVELKGCGHSPMIDDLKQLLNVMEMFF